MKMDGNGDWISKTLYEDRELWGVGILFVGDVRSSVAWAHDYNILITRGSSSSSMVHDDGLLRSIFY